ncbi:MAG: hypothetical protein L6R36_000556 [Xanthoria steineri]|nr:MAG: hypothetical protein L6R36_000556 [Xanthoria steineri]
MGPWYAFGVLYWWFLLCQGSLATPLVVPSDRLQISQPTLSAGNVPAAFKVELTSDHSVLIRAEEILRPALKMMYRVTGLPLSQVWYDENWPSPLGPSGIYIRHSTFGKEPSRLRSDFLIWGMNHLLLSMQLTTRYCQTTAVLKWDGVTVGTIYVSRNPPRGVAWTGRNTSEAGEDLAGESKPLSNGRFDMSLSYGEKPIDRHLLYLTCIKAMGDAAETGLTRLVPGLYTLGLQRTAWKLLGDHREIEAGYSREAAVTALGRMIHDDKFFEVVVWVKVHGVQSAVGGYTQGF